MDVRNLVSLVGLAATLVVVSACSASTGGQPLPTASSTRDQPPVTSTPGGGGNGLPVDHPCSLLSQNVLSQINASAPPTEDMVGTAHDCSVLAQNFNIGVAIRTDLGLPGFTATGTVQDITIGKHQAKKVVDDTGSCVIGIGVSASSEVEVTVLPDDNQDPCPTAMTLANAIEPKLP